MCSYFAESSVATDCHGGPHVARCTSTFNFDSGRSHVLLGGMTLFLVVSAKLVVLLGIIREFTCGYPQCLLLPTRVCVLNSLKFVLSLSPDVGVYPCCPLVIVISRRCLRFCRGCPPCWCVLMQESRGTHVLLVSLRWFVARNNLREVLHQVRCSTLANIIASGASPFVLRTTTFINLKQVY